ncbi:multicopper oxidase domain-containing protein [Haloechinothrix halophila]|uniref:multicopper oxidase domain-containing protein n=1 Tax=Haloechinothrix halophila TaxID=1069073 RepID=UPI0003F78046|nr:multicopper oxidase domain-containing protein [Haloechinothrix halophila]
MTVPESPEHDHSPPSRRKFLLGGALAGTAGAAALGIGGAMTASADNGGQPGHSGSQSGHAHAHGGGAKGPTFRMDSRVDHDANGFHPTDILRDFDYGTTSRTEDGRVLREWDVYATDEEIEVAPGVTFPAWTFNGRIPGPTLRCTEGDRLRVRFHNGSKHPHTMHFHGMHPAEMDGIPGLGAGTIEPGGSTVYEFDAEPFGVHLYHCHVGPLAEHMARGLYGTFIVDPKQGRPEADEQVMVMHGFNTTFDGEGNQLYAVNGIPFHYMHEPVQVKLGELVRIYLVNTLEYDPINSFHVHGNFFDYYPTGTRLEPSEFTDTIIQGQGQRGICEMRFKYPGKYMFHAHKTEFAELGWMGFFEVTE